MNLSFNLDAILSPLFIFCFPLLLLSSYSSSHHSVACPMSLVTSCFTFLSSSTSSYSKCLSMDLIQSSSSPTSKLHAYIGISILALPPNIATAFSKYSWATSSHVASLTTFFPMASSLSTSLTSQVSGALLCASSIASYFAQKFFISLYTSQFPKGCYPRLLSIIVLTVYHTQSTILSYFFSSPFLVVCKKISLFDTT
jgi:hypothetical protein